MFPCKLYASFAMLACRLSDFPNIIGTRLAKTTVTTFFQQPTTTYYVVSNVIYATAI